jgi:hypothetical protein
MIIKYNLFEFYIAHKKNEPEVGDYVLVNIKWKVSYSDLKRELNESIGKIIDIDYNQLFGEYHIEFENILDYKIYDVSLTRIEIKSFSKNKKQLELEIAANKYNI